ASETDLYRFDAQAGNPFFFDIQARSGAPGAIWRLISPYGTLLFNTNSSFNTDIDTLTLPQTGTYTLLVEGSITDTGSGTYTFNAQRVVDSPAPMTLGSTVSGTIGAPGGGGVYTFILPADARLYFDAQTNTSNLTWSLTGPVGTPVSNRAFTAADGPILV